jgi:hypothetical protein
MTESFVPPPPAQPHSPISHPLHMLLNNRSCCCQPTHSVQYRSSLDIHSFLYHCSLFIIIITIIIIIIIDSYL